MAVLAAAAVWPGIFLLRYAGRAADDQARFHERAVRAFSAQWPAPDLHDYASATSPGYHLALAAIDRVIGPEAGRTTLQFAGSMFTVALAALLAWLARRELRESRDFARHDRALHAGAHAGERLDGLRSVVVCLPVLASIYVWSSGVWMLPDNAGWLGMLAVLGLALARVNGWATTPQRLLIWWAGAASALALVVFTRQSHVWGAGLLLTGAYLLPAGWPKLIVRDESAASLVFGVLRRLLAALMALSACLPAVLILAYLANHWGGLVPPSFQAQHAAGVNAATPALSMSLLAIYSFFFAGFLLSALGRVWHEHRWIVLCAVVLGVLMAVIPETTYKHEPRASGLWNLVRAMEVRGVVLLGRTSPLLVVLAPIGCVALVAWVAMVRGARRWLVLAAFVGFILAQTANSNAWQRYLEPGLLMFAAIWSAWGWNPHAAGHHRHTRHRDRRLGNRLDPTFPALAWRWIGPAALAFILAGVTALDQRNASRVATYAERAARTTP